MKKRVLSILLCAAMTALLLPTSAFAEDPVEILETEEDFWIEDADTVVLADPAEDVDTVEAAAAAVESIYISGVYDTVPWKIMKITSDETEEYRLLIGEEGQTYTFTEKDYRTESSFPWYSYCKKITSGAVLGKVYGNGSHRGMFAGCMYMTELDVSGFDTTNVTNMNSMFAGLHHLNSLDVSGFNTSNVTDMSNMFFSCRLVPFLDVSGFDTSKVTSMGYMFGECWGLEKLDVSGFDTSNVTDMTLMFSGCKCLTSLNVSGFDTANVTRMNGMFHLQQPDFSGSASV